MCGVACLINFHPEEARERVGRMLAAMRRRGPDASKTYCLPDGAIGHCRLSIIDTSDLAAQPMRRAGVTLAYNGECYNFLEERRHLQKKGHRFRSMSDTEVVLALYLEYGPEFIHRLRGIFAFILHDERNGLLLAARDHLGVKPLYYWRDGNTLLLASSLRAMLASDLPGRAVNRRSLQHLLAFGCTRQPETILADVHSLMPGHILRAQERHFSIKPYWELTVPEKRRAAYPDLLEEGESLLRECIRLQRVSDVPLGAFLSSGVDSALLAALAQQDGEIETLSVGFQGSLDTAYYDESSEAALLARHIGCRHETVYVTPEEIARQISSIARDLDHPSVDGVNSWVVSRAAAQNMRVALSGTGGDELFAGYLWFQGLDGRLVRESSLPGAQKNITHASAGEPPGLDPVAARIFRLTCFTPPALAKSICPCPDQADFAPNDPLHSAQPVDRMTGLTLAGFTRDQLLPDIDAASMAHSLEIRVPLLDIRLLEFALSLPAEARLGPPVAGAPAGSYAASGVKRILLDLAAPLLPKDFAFRPKRGFTLPFDSWLRGVLAPTCNAIFSREALARRGWFEPEPAARLWADFLNGRASWYQVWVLLMTELWAQETLDGF